MQKGLVRKPFGLDRTLEETKPTEFGLALILYYFDSPPAWVSRAQNGGGWPAAVFIAFVGGPEEPEPDHVFNYFLLKL